MTGRTEDAHRRDIRVISAIGMRDVIADIQVRFEATSGRRLNATVVETGEVRARVLAGEPFDVIIVPGSVAQDLQKRGKMAAGFVPLVRVNFGLAVRADGATPDTRTPEALKLAFLAADTVLISDPATGGISGVHVMEVLDALGIADAMKGKLAPLRGGGSHAERVVRGEADLAVQAEHEIRCVHGARFLAYPKEFQRSVVLMAGIATASRDPAAAKALITFMQGPDALAAITARRLTPA